MKKFIALALVFMALGAVQALAQCPSSSFGVGACAPASWVFHREFVEIAPKCSVEVVFCSRWVCSDIDALKRHEVIISSIRTVPNPNDGPDDCPDLPSSGTSFGDEMNDFLGFILSQLVADNTFTQYWPIFGCNDVSYIRDYVVYTTACAARGVWSGSVDFADFNGVVNTSGESLVFCGNSSLNCKRTYRICDDLSLGRRTTTLLSSDWVDNSGNTATPTSAQLACNGNSAGTFPSFVIASMGGQGIPITTTSQNTTSVYGCTSTCEQP